MVVVVLTRHGPSVPTLLAGLCLSLIKGSVMNIKKCIILVGLSTAFCAKIDAFSHPSYGGGITNKTPYTFNNIYTTGFGVDGVGGKSKLFSLPANGGRFKYSGWRLCPDSLHIDVSSIIPTNENDKLPSVQSPLRLPCLPMPNEVEIFIDSKGQVALRY